MEELQILLESGQFKFEYPWVWWLLLLPFAARLLPAQKTKPAALVMPTFGVLSKLSGTEPSTGVTISKKSIIGKIVTYLVWLFLIFAAASPEIVGEPQKQIKTARNFLLNIDLSLSMETRDWINKDGKRVSRWDAVKEVMGEFITQRQSDRMGLILFGSQAYLQTPFTDDLEVVRSLMNDSEVGMAGAKTAIGNSIGKSVELFERDSIQEKVMVLVTDGADSGSELKPIQAARLAAVDSITIYTIGIGTKRNQTYELDDYTLKEIAKATNGQYFEANDREQLEQVYTTLEELEPVEYENKDFVPKHKLFHYPLIVALILPLLYHLILGVIKSIKKIKPSSRTHGAS